MTPLLLALALLALLCLVGGLGMLGASRLLRARSGLPAGAIVYSDTGARRDLNEPLRSRRLGLVGKPDYLLERTEGGRRGKRVIIPVEVKSGRAHAQPHAGHVLQVGAYCLLVEEVYGVTPAYGLLRYADGTHPVPLTPALRAEVLETAAAIRAARRAPTVARSHNAPERCRGCTLRASCGEALS